MTGQLTGHMSVGVTVKIASNGKMLLSETNFKFALLAFIDKYGVPTNQ